MSDSNSQPIKYSVHKTVTTKHISPQCAGQIVRISITDGDATEEVIRIRGPDATTNIIRPPLGAATNSGEEESLENLSSPTSVLKSRYLKTANSGEEKDHKGRVVEDPPPPQELLMDDCLPLDQCFLKDYFDFRSPSPLIYDEVRVQETVLEDVLLDGLDFELGHEFGSLTWDVSEFLEDQILVG
ncbi:cytokinin response factor 4 [Striga asiatica]|uniref:Cytokinin response factor 4 n=1 Tax=Striga asiatica TaxID=4170 RepID=A0A5A7R053_STRAF|nr:cytokinin response factor 4 [Striga asiatica]